MLVACIAVLVLPSIVVRGVDAYDRLQRQRAGSGLPSTDELGALMRRCQVTTVFGPEVVLCPQAQPIGAFSPYLVSAVVASEDRRFAWHDGVDRSAILRAIVGYFGPGAASGGSTLTQQVARTLFLTRAPETEEADGLSWWLPDGIRRDLAGADRKRKEWIVARRLEQVADKRAILTAYLNIAPHVDGLFGFEAASRHLFGRAARDVTLDEAAMLVAMLPGPNARHPVRHPERLLAVAGGVLADMQAAGLATAGEVRQAMRAAERKLGGGRLVADRRMQRTAKRPFEHRRVRDLARIEAAARGVDLDKAARLFLTLDPAFQAMADAEVRKSPAGYQASAFFVDRRGEVLAIAGPAYGETQFNAAFDGLRSIGSIGKSMLYAAAAGSGLAESSYSTARLAGYSPREDSGWCRGRMALTDALAHSCNRPFVRLAADLGSRAGRLVRDFGFAVPDNPLLIATGGVHGNPMMTTRLVSTFAGGGVMREPVSFAGALDAEGRILVARAAPAPRRVLPEKVARRVATDLRLPVTADHGTARAAAGRNRAAHVAGKTGTSNGGKDAWFAGFTADFAGTVVAQAKHGGALTGGAYPAESFGAIVDGYWTRRNWMAGPEGQAAASRPIEALELSASQVRALGPEILRIGGMFVCVVWLIALLRRRPQPTPGLDLPGDVAPSPYRPPVTAADALRSGTGA